MNNFTLKHSLLLLVVAFLVCTQNLLAQQSNSPSQTTNQMDWQFDCANQSEVEIIGSGTQVAGSPPIVLNIPNHSDADSVMLEIVYKGAVTGPIPTSATISSSNGQYLINTNPITLPAFGTQYVGGVFRTMMQPAASYTATVQPPGSQLVTWSIIAYIYKSGSAQGKASIGTYNKALILNTFYTIKVPVPVTAGPKDITIMAPITELDYEPNRISVVEAIAGNVVGYDTLSTPNFGLSFAMNPFTLYNVAGSVDTVAVNLISPSNGTGDSFIGGVFVEIQNCCVDLPTINPVATSNVSCNGAGDGMIDISITGGISPFNFVWNNGSTSEDVSNLTPGNYQVSVYDSYGCNSSYNFSITEPKEIKAFASKTNVVCNGENNGSIDLKVWGGTPPYSYFWNDGILTQDRNSLMAGIYTVTITDANGCQKVITKNIVEPTLLKVIGLPTSVSCFGGNDGSIWVNTKKGVAPYTFMWNDGVTTKHRNNLSAGVYTLTVTDAKGCTKEIIRNVKQPKQLNARRTVTTVSCFGGNDGQVELSIFRGTPPYSVIWSNGSTSSTISNLSTGNYTATITDANSCEIQRSAVIVEPSEINISASILHNVSGYNMNNGMAEVYVNGGVAPYSYAWSNGSQSKTNTNLYAGTYTVTVTDANNCTATADVLLSQPDSLMLTTTHTNVSCFGDNNGSLDVLSLSGGVQPYSYFWSTGDTVPFVGNLAPGTYNLVVIDANGNSVNSNETITQPISPIFPSSNHVQPLCNGGNDGLLDGGATGGTAPYYYLWSNGGTTENVQGISAGNYTLTVTDANGCTAISYETVTEPSPIVINSVITNVSCNGANDGAIDISVSGGNPVYVYSWTNGSFNEDISGLAPGTYTVFVTDANGGTGCTINQSFTITEPDSLNAVISGINPNCYDGNDGEINISISGGTAPYSYLWNTGDITQNLTNVSAGSYSVTITDSNSCTEAANIIITEPTQFNIQITASINVSGNGLSNGSATANATGGIAPYTYAWSDGQTGTTAINLSAGTYTVTATDSNGCTDETTVLITEPQTLVVTTSHVDVLCNGESTGIVSVVNTTGGVFPYSYLWSTGSTNIILTNVPAGTYTVTATDANGNTANSQETVIEPQSALSAQTSSAMPLCNGGSDGSAMVIASGGTSPYIYLWNGGQTGATASHLIAGTYTVTITDANGCTYISTAQITEPSALTGNINAINATCNGLNDGTLDLTVNGGTPPYNYIWNTGSVTEDLTGLGAGTYTVSISDANGCTLVISKIITQPLPIQLSIANTPVTCNGGNDGTIDLTVNGGVGSFSYAWSNQQITEDLNAVSAGIYTVTVTDLHSGSSCTSSISTTVTEPTIVNVQISASINVSGNGLSNGSATANVTGGIAPYTYVWSDGQTGTTAINLSAGTYTVTATDSNGCTDETTVLITEPQTLVVTTSHVDVLCNGESTGIVSVVNTTGGVFPYSYLWSTGSTNIILTNVPAGTYTVTATDANGNTASSQETVIEPQSALSAQTSSAIPFCNGGSDGSAMVIASGGTSPYTYLWNGGQTGATASHLIAGTYTVTITDANGCTYISTAQITEPSALTGNINAINATCNGLNDGTLDLTVNGGTPPYNYNWNTGSVTEDLTGLGAGTYTVSISDANGCTLILTESISQPLPIQLFVNNTPVSCYGGNDGSIDLMVLGGVGPFIYAWSNQQSTEDLVAVAAGAYTVTVTDQHSGSSCNAAISTTVVEPGALAGSIAVTNVTCVNLSNGGLDLTVSGGVAPYTYLWNTGSVNQNLVNIASGNYTVTVTDANGCTIVFSETVAEPTALTAIAVTGNVTCNSGNNGNIDVTVSGGTPPYMYLWNTGNNTQDLNSTTAGTYTVTITDSNGCTIQLSEVINEPLTLNGNLIGNNVLCNGGTNGSVNLTVTGGTVPYNYVWNTGDTTQNIFNLVAGIYTVTITDANGCTLELSKEVLQPAFPIFPSSNHTPPLCNGGNDGFLDGGASGGTPPYIYLWSTGDTTENVQGVTAGNYTLTVTDANGCSAISFETVTEPTEIIISSAVTDVTCNGANNGSIDISVSGGNPGYVYYWNNGSTTEDISGLSPGNYMVYVTDANGGTGCTVSKSFVITEPTPLSIHANTTDVICFGENTGSILVTVNGGTSPYAYSWATGETTNSISNLIAGSYTVSIVDANNCMLTETLIVNEPAELTATSIATNLLCFNGNNGSIDVTPKGGTTPYTYLWSTGAVTQDLLNVQQGTYTVYITDANGCSVQETNTITDPTAIVLSANVNNVSCHGANDGAINLTAIGGTLPYTYFWNTGDTTINVSNLIPGSYTVTVTDANGCTAIRTEIISEPNQLALSAVVTNANCSGDCNGTIDLTVAGGTQPYSYLWNANVPVPSFICAGANATNGSGGIMFDITATNSLDITALDLNLNSGNKIVDVYYKSGSYLGFENNPSAWLSAGNYNVVSTGAGTATHITLNSSIFANTGETIAFFIAANSGLKYSNGTGAGQLQTSDVNIQVFEGIGRGSNLFTSTIFQDRLFSGCIYYTSNANSSSTAQDLIDLCEGDYTVTVTDANGCSASTSVTIGIDNNLDVMYTSADPSCGNQSVCNITRLIEWNDANCQAFSGSTDYSEFTPIYSSIACTGLTATNLNRICGGHSCNTGRSGGNGMGFCIGGLDSPNWVSNSSKALRFTVTTGANESGTLSALKFYELSTSPVYQNGVSGSINNNYPTKYGVRVLKNGTEVFLQTNINTSTNWSLESIDFSGISAFEYTGANTYEFELFAYSPVGNGYTKCIWDLDEIYLEGCCNTTGGPVCDGSIDLTVTGGSGQYSYQWTADVDSITVTNTHLVDAQINHGCDDSEEYVTDGSILISGNHLDMSYQSSNEQLVGMRFRNLNIPQGATITSARIEFVAKFNSSNHSDLVFYTEDIDNSTAFTTTNYDISSRALSSTSVAWNNVPGWVGNQKYNSVDLSSLVQERVNSANWNSGNAMSFIVDGTGQRPAISYEFCAPLAPRLLVTYELTNVITPPTPVLTGPNPTNLCPGEYCVLVTDLVSGCIDSVCITLGYGSFNTKVVNDSICAGDSILLGGSYQYSSGTFIDTVINSSGCTDIITTNLFVNTPLQINTFTIDPTCGAITIPSSCPCNGKMKEVSAVYQGISGATITIKDKNGITMTTIVNVQYNQVIVVNAAAIGLQDLGPKTHWHVNNGQGVEIHTSCSQVIVGLTFGDFYVIGYIDGAGVVCGSPISSLCNGSITASVNGGTAPYTYNWTSVNNSNLNLNGSSLNNLCEGDYNLTVTDNLGCSQSTVVTLVDPACSATPRYASEEIIQNRISEKLTAYPNPSNGKLNLGFDVAENTQLNIQILDISGRIVFNRTENVFSGFNQFPIDLTEIAKGVYMLKGSWGADSETLRIIIN